MNRPESAGGGDGQPQRSGTESQQLGRASRSVAIGFVAALLLLGGIGTVNFRSALEIRALSAERTQVRRLLGDRQKALAVGCAGYIEKPIDPETFATQVKKFLAKGKGND